MISPAIATRFRSAYIGAMLSRVRIFRGGQRNLPAAFIIPCRPSDDYAPLCLGSGEKISGSNTSLMSELSVRYF